MAQKNFFFFLGTLPLSDGAVLFFPTVGLPVRAQREGNSAPFCQAGRLHFETDVKLRGL